ncbi:MAG: CBS domain-containing protein [Myxococcales bacterium]|nr:CBS domain-containing protein [Myxococcales bacterium]
MNLQEIAHCPIRDAQRKAPACVDSDTPLIEVVETMRERECDAVAIVDESGVLIGIFSSRDLTNRVDHSNHDWHGVPVFRAMTADPICTKEGDDLTVALGLMQKGSFRHLPHVDAEGRPMTILSVRDILVFVSEHFPKEILNLPPDANYNSSPWGG